MKEFTYHFIEQSKGSITIRGDKEPPVKEVIKKIENGDGFFHSSEYINIKLVEEAAA